MTRTPFDRFSKQCLQELFLPSGTATSDYTFDSEVRQADIVFVPDLDGSSNLEALGLLGRFGQTTAILEPFHNPLATENILSCASKLLDLDARIRREARREERDLSDRDLPRLWLLSPTISARVREEFKAETDLASWPPGVYFCGGGWRTNLVAIHQLPPTPETLWLRLLGRGKVQLRAIAELEALPGESPFRDKILELVYDLVAMLEARQHSEASNPEEQELIMQLSPMYAQRLEAATQQGEQKGRQEGIQMGRAEGQQLERRLLSETLLRSRFGSLDAELEAIATAMTELSAADFSQLALELPQLTRQALAARLNN